MEKKELTPGQKKGCFGCLGIIALVIMIAIIIAIVMDSSANNKKQDGGVRSMDTSLSINERIEGAVISAVGDETNMGEKRIINIDTETDIVKITLFADENVTTNSTKVNMMVDARDVLKAIDPINEIKNVAIIWQYTLVDTYGNKSVNDVMRIFIQRDEIDKINFDDFNAENLPNLAYNYYLHPAFQ